MANDEAPWFSALFGQIWDRVSGQLGLLGGLEFTGGIRARRNLATKRIEVYADGLTVIVEDATTTYTAAATDHGSHREMTSASAITVSLPDGLPEGHWQSFAQAGAGQITLAASGSATLAANGGKTKSTEQGSVIVALNLGGDEWRIFGGLTA